MQVFLVRMLVSPPRLPMGCGDIGRLETTNQGIVVASESRKHRINYTNCEGVVASWHGLLQAVVEEGTRKYHSVVKSAPENRTTLW